MPQRPGRGPQDQHNVMPIAINPVRFTLLPLSSHHAEKNESQFTKVNLQCVYTCLNCEASSVSSICTTSFPGSFLYAKTRLRIEERAWE